MNKMLLVGVFGALAVFMLVACQPADADLLKTYDMPGSSPETWYNDVVDLSAYDGHTIQLAWRYTSNNEYLCCIDDITIHNQSWGTVFSENFDSLTDDGYDGTPGPYPSGWTEQNDGTLCSTSYHYWGAESYKYHSSPNSMGCYYNCPNDDWIYTPEIDLTGSNNELDYWYFWDDSWDIYMELHIFDLGPMQPIHPYGEPCGVGGDVHPVGELELLAPYFSFGLIAAAILGLAAVVIRKRNT